MQLLYSDYYLLLPLIVNFLIYWIIFFKMNFSTLQVERFRTDKVYISDVNKGIQYVFYLKLNQIFLFFELAAYIIHKGFLNPLWWNHFKISNILVFLILILFIVNFFFLRFVEALSKNGQFYKSDYFFALINLSIFLPIIFFINTFFTFIFILEVNSCIIFYKFIVSKFWYKNSLKAKSKEFYSFQRTLPKNYLSMLFFQYWSTFFSSILLMYVLICYIYIYGTSEWLVLGYLNLLNMYINYFSATLLLIILNILLIIAFLIKLGFTPLQLYKIEIYKGIPYIAIFFYTTYYFLVFFTFVILLFIYYLGSMSIYWEYLLIFTLIIGSFYIISLLFDLNYIRAFFAYSTLINSMGFLCIVLAIFTL